MVDSQFTRAKNLNSKQYRLYDIYQPTYLGRPRPLYSSASSTKKSNFMRRPRRGRRRTITFTHNRVDHVIRLHLRTWWHRGRQPGGGKGGGFTLSNGIKLEHHQLFNRTMLPMSWRECFWRTLLKDNFLVTLLPRYLAVWPDWEIYWALGNFSKPVGTISLHKSTTLLGTFCKGVKNFNFSCEIIFGQLS